MIYTVCRSPPFRRSIVDASQPTAKRIAPGFQPSSGARKVPRSHHWPDHDCRFLRHRGRFAAMTIAQTMATRVGRARKKQDVRREQSYEANDPSEPLDSRLGGSRTLNFIRKTGQKPRPAREAFAKQKWKAIRLVRTAALNCPALPTGGWELSLLCDSRHGTKKVLKSGSFSSGEVQANRFTWLQLRSIGGWRACFCLYHPYPRYAVGSPAKTYGRAPSLALPST
jgi:hypothetical protein